jgi:Mg/Co/Ni transporter MgtE
MAAGNMQSLSPNSRPAPTQQVNAPKKKEGQMAQQPASAPTTAAYESESFDFDAIFDGENLSEQFKEKMKIVFEAAVNEKVTQITEALTTEANSILEEEIQKVTSQLTEKLDDYLNYVIEEWMDENKLTLEEGIKVDVAESFLTGLKELFETHYVQIPEGKNDLLDSLQERTDELEAQLNEKINESIELNKQLLEYQCNMTFLESTDGLTDTQIEKLASLTEGLEYNSVEQYTEKLNVLKETYVKQMSSNRIKPLFESFEETTDKTIAAPASDSMSVYMSALNRQAKK